jgi:hypothetical protein
MEPAKIDAQGRMLETNAPPSDAPTLGWVRSKWKSTEGGKQACAACGRGVRRGVQNHRHRGPGRPILCDRCYDAIMADPGPAGWAGEGLN